MRGCSLLCRLERDQNKCLLYGIAGCPLLRGFEYRKSGNFLQKLACTINANAVRDRSYENFLHENLSYESFFTRKFPDLQYIEIYGNTIRTLRIICYYRKCPPLRDVH